MNSDPVTTDAVRLYDRFAGDYDRSFDAHPMLIAYERLVWDRLQPLLPATGGTIVDVGCGTGRHADRLLRQGYRVVGIEPSPAMQDVLDAKLSGLPGWSLIRGSMEDAAVAEGSADVVMAIGSIQYAPDPAAMTRRFLRWLRPGGVVVLFVDSLVALTFELLRLGKAEEAERRLEDKRGVFTYQGAGAGLHLYSAGSLTEMMAAEGITGIEVFGILVSASALGRDACETAIRTDMDAVIEIERRLQRFPELADAGKHLMAWGTKP